MFTKKVKPPSSKTTYPLRGMKRTVYLKNIIKDPNIIVGDYTYYDDPESIYNFEKNVLYLFPFLGDRLIIGKFCQIASGVRFLMNGGNHSMNGVSTYPFRIFQEAWAEAPMDIVIKGDTRVGNDVWIGNSVTFMPGVCVGDGAIIAASSVVTKDVPPYTVVGGNPAKEIRKRFDEETISFLCELKWWDWPVERITQHLDLLTGRDIPALKKLMSELELTSLS